MIPTQSVCCLWFATCPGLNSSTSVCLSPFQPMMAVWLSPQRRKHSHTWVRAKLLLNLACHLLIIGKKEDLLPFQLSQLSDVNYQVCLKCDCISLGYVLLYVCLTDMMEPEVCTPTSLPTSLRFRCSSMLVPGQWHHLTVVMAKDVKKSCLVSAYFNGKAVGTGKVRLGESD